MKRVKKIISFFIIAIALASPITAKANSFTDIFGGSSVSPSEVAYAAYSFGTGGLQLFWPQFSNGQPNVAARFMNLTATTTGLNVTMPDATLNSVGYDAIIFNAGMNSFNVVGFTGGAIATIAPGQTYYILLNGNTTQNGTWQTVQFGVGTGSANAAALAGPGLLAVAGLLQVNLSGIPVSNSFALTSAGLAQLYVWTGGSGVITLPGASSVQNGFFFMLANNGSGSVTVAPSSGTVDGNSTSVFSQTQSGFIMSDGANWFTVGKGIQNTFAVTLLNLNVAGSTDVTETSAQAQNIIQQYTGTITGNINVIVPATVQLYFVNNATSGPFTLTVKTAAGSGIVVPQGSNAILYCDGTNVVNAFTASVSGTLALTSGSAVSPSLAFQGSAGTGLFSAVASTFSATANTTEVLRFLAQTGAVNRFNLQASSTGNSANFFTDGSDTNITTAYISKGTGQHAFYTEGPVTASPQLQFLISDTPSTVNVLDVTGAVTGNAPGLLAAGTDTNINLNVTPKGTGTLNTTKLAASGNSTIGGTLGVTGQITGNLTGNVTGNVSGNASTVTTNANLTGPITSSGNATSIAAQTGTGSVFAVQTSPTFIGTVTIPTLSVGTAGTYSGTQNFTGSTITVPTQAANDNSTKAASTAYVDGSNFAPKASPAFTGIPTAPTASNGTNTTQLATTAFSYGTLSAGTTGYVVLPNGLIFEWGFSNSVTNPRTVSFPLTFPNNAFTVTATGQGTNNSIQGVSSLTTSGFTLSQGNVSAPAYWNAVGN